MEKNLYVVVVWYGGIPHILQMRGVVNWFFYNNHPKCFKTLDSAKRNAHILSAKYMCESVKVYSLSQNECVCTDEIRRWEREERERIVFSVVK